MAVNYESTIFQGDDDMHDNDDSPPSMVVDNDSNCLCDTSDSNESSSFSKIVVVPIEIQRSSSMNWPE